MITVIEHPLIQIELTTLRNKNSTQMEFNHAAQRIGYHLAFNSLSQLPLEQIVVETPEETCQGFTYSGNVACYFFLPNGGAFIKAFGEIFPNMKIGYINCEYSYKTDKTEENYYYSPPIDSNTSVILCDFSIVTGSRLSAALSHIQLEGPADITVVSVLTSQEAIEKICTDYPSTRIITCSLEREINDEGILLPGVGNITQRLNGSDSSF